LIGDSKELYNEIINLPFNNSQKKYEEIKKQILSSKVISQENKTYMEKLNDTKEKWCYAYRKDESILGIQTTSRIESLHALMKRNIRSKCSLTELLIRLIEFAHNKNNHQIEEKVDDEIVRALSKNTFLTKIKEKYSEYIFDKCILNFVKASNLKSKKKKTHFYEVTSTDPNDKQIYTVTIVNSILNCTCFYNMQWGIPCSHMFATANMNEGITFTQLPFKNRWEKKIHYSHNDEKLIEFLKKKRENEGNINGFLIYLFVFIL